MKYRLKTAFVGAVLLWTAAASASALKDLKRLLESRAQQYTEQRPALEQRTQESATAAVRSIQSADRSAAEALNTALGETRQLSYLYGRYQTLWALREHMETKPSLATSETWLQGQVEAIRAKIASADATEAALKRSVPGSDVPLLSWVGSIERLAQDRGYSEGATAELSLINEDLRTYYAARAEEHENAVRLRTALLAAFAMALSQQQDDMRDLGVGSVAGARAMGSSGRYGRAAARESNDAGIRGSTAVTLCPDGTYVGGKTCSLAPNGRYVGGVPRITPKGDYVGGQPQMTPKGDYVGGSGKVTMCADGTYVSGRCRMTPKGGYVGD